MTIGLPKELSFQSSNVKDNAHTLDELTENCQAPVIQKGLEVQGGEWVYEYQGNIDFTPKVWTANDENKGVYKMDEVIFKDCKLYKVTGKSGTGITTHKKPKEPEDYSCHDTDINPSSWKCRYFKVSAETQCNWLTKKWDFLFNRYAIVWCAGSNSYEWVVTDKRVGSGCGTVYNILERSPKYTSANDNKAVLMDWGAMGNTPALSIVFKSMIEREGFFYLRTSVNAKLEYYTWTTGTAFKYQYTRVKSPADIDGFKQKRRTQAHNPFDGKHYTKTIFDTGKDGYARWDLLVVQWVDSLALGRLICDTVDFIISDEAGNKLFQLNNYPIDNSVAPGRPEQYPTTRIIYADHAYPPGSVITLILRGSRISIGEILGASKLSAGFTKVAFKNKYKDFSPKELDKWGNWTYVNGVRVHVHSGTVEYPVVSYDQINRLMLLLGGQRVVINSSDSTKNEIPDGRHVFDATMLIARFTRFDLSTSEHNKRIGERGTYNFEIEELV